LIRQRDLTGFSDSDGHRHIVSMFADDTAVCLSKESDYIIFSRNYKVYAEATGAALNLGKTKIVGFDVRSVRPVTIGGIVVAYDDSSEKYLGVPIGMRVNYETVWAGLISKIENQILKWSKVHLSLRGRIAISKNVLLGRIWYLARLIPSHADSITKIDTLVWTYIW
ncbi:hypothetical protein DFH27DRAFT_461629, partial [Peziza echinospora]